MVLNSANDTVLEFYPKFGFKRTNEYIYKLESSIPDSKHTARKLNIKNITDFALIENLLEKRKILTKIFGARDYQFISMWHILYVYPQNLYYLEEDNILFILSIKKQQLYIWDIIFSKPFDISHTLPKILPGNNINKIFFYFPPDQVHFKYDEIIEDDDTLFFVKGNFSLKDKQFKFPTTAQT